jgi:hypothetical protein
MSLFISLSSTKRMRAMLPPMGNPMLNFLSKGAFRLSLGL